MNDEVATNLTKTESSLGEVADTGSDPEAQRGTYFSVALVRGIGSDLDAVEETPG